MGLRLVSFPALPAQILTASDLADDLNGVSVDAGGTVDPGRMLFDVAPDPTASTFTVSFIDDTYLGQYLINNFSDEDGNAVNVDSLESADFSIQSQTVVLEPSAAILLLRLLMCLWARNRLVRVRRARAARS